MTRRYTQKKGQKNEKKKGGYRGSLGSASTHGAFTTGATQELKQMGGTHSRATQKSIEKLLKKQKNIAEAAEAAKKAAEAAKKAENNAKRAIHEAIEIQREQHAQNRKMINSLVHQLEKKQSSAKPFVPRPVNNQIEKKMKNMVNNIVGK